MEPNQEKTESKSKLLLFKVSSSSNIHKVSEAIFKSFLEGKNIEVQAIGGGAVNQAVKSLVLARSKLSLSGLNIAFIAGFKDVENTRRNEGTISALNFTLIEVANGKQ